MNLKELRENFERHVNNVSIEQFERELVEAGINNCPDVQETHMLELPSEIILAVQVDERKAFWGTTIYSQPPKGVGVEGDNRRVA